MYSLGVAAHCHPANLYLSNQPIFLRIYTYIFIYTGLKSKWYSGLCVSVKRLYVVWYSQSSYISINHEKSFHKFSQHKIVQKKNYVLWILKYSLIGMVFPFAEAIPHGRRYEKAMSGLSCIVVGGGAIHYGLNRLWLWTMRCDVMRGGLR